MGNPLEIEENFDDAAIDELEPGHTLMQGQFTIDAFLNAGGFGITYLARNSLGRKVVIKECFPGSFCRRSATSVRARSRSHTNELSSIVRKFVAEAHSLAKVNHPNIVGVHQVFEENKTAYMALDFVEGHDLLALIEGQGKLPEPAQIETILSKMLGAVSAIHEQDMLHRDISPDNILLKSDLEPVLIDFGAARQDAGSENRILSELRVIKDGYSPQEFYVSGADQGPSSDLYALAATFYHVITGEIPVNSQSRLAAVAAGDGDPYLPVVGRMPAYSEQFLRGIDRALAILPNDRFSSAQQWLELLSGHGNADDAATHAKSKETLANASAPLPKTSKMSRARILGAIGLAIPIIGGVAVLQMSGDGPSVEETTVALADSNSSVTAVATGTIPAIAPGASDPIASDIAPSNTGAAQVADTVAPALANDLSLTLGLPAANDALASAGVSTLQETTDLEPVRASLVADTNDTPIEAIMESFDLPQVVSAWSVDLTGSLPAPAETIYEINGLPLDSGAEIDTVLHQMMQAPEGGTMTLSVLVGESKNLAVTESINVPVVHKTSFSNGTTFETRMVDDAWATIVTNAPDGSRFEVDDILVGDANKGEFFDKRTSLPDALVHANAQNLDWLTLGVRRQGIMSPISMPVPR